MSRKISQFAAFSRESHISSLGIHLVNFLVATRLAIPATVVLLIVAIAVGVELVL